MPCKNCGHNFTSHGEKVQCYDHDKKELYDTWICVAGVTDDENEGTINYCGCTRFVS